MNEGQEKIHVINYNEIPPEKNLIINIRVWADMGVEELHLISSDTLRQIYDLGLDSKIIDCTQEMLNSERRDD